MEFDNLQQLWQSQALQHPKREITSVHLEMAASKLNDSRKKLLRKIRWEIMVGMIIYISAGLFMFLGQLEKKELLFTVKMMLLIALYAIPTTMHLYQTIRKLTISDYAIALNTFLLAKMNNLRKAYRIYLFSGLLTCLFITITLLTDEFFLSKSLKIKIAGLSYVILFAALLTPMLHLFYGREIKQLQKQLQQFDETSA
jgi:hypothetical protein